MQKRKNIKVRRKSIKAESSLAQLFEKNDKKISQFLFFVIFFRLTADGGGGCFPEKKINSSEQKKVTLIFSPNSLND